MTAHSTAHPTQATLEAPAAPRSPADLFWSCSAIALQGFGGVLAVVQRELVERRGWLTREQFVEDWAVAQILPGPNVVNLALVLGDRHFGVRGALAAVAGMLLFPLGLLVAIAVGFSAVASLPAAQGALRGMGLVAAGLIAGTALWHGLPADARAAARLQTAPSALSTTEPLTDYKAVTTYNNFYEFGTDKSDPVAVAEGFQSKPWSVVVDGECDKPGTYAYEDLVRPHKLEERLYRFRCVEAWSMVI
ncbi:MAG: chromate transporter, partial [Rhodoferax sp.]|nr:chromate transporter [Rhodoferax sp.]